MGSRMYSDYFGITENAFSITPDPRFLFRSEQHCEALAHLLYGVVESGCFVLLTGEVGTGKTTICRTLLEQLPENVDVALLLNPPQSGQELLLSITDELHVFVNHRDGSIHELVYLLTRRLLENHSKGRRTVVIIDEAQNITPDVLEQVRLLTNLETHTEKLLHVFLVGQPELRTLLKKPSLRQVAQRITARYHLQPLSADETRDYIYHRLSVAGCRQGLFSEGALRAIYRESKGVPRVINILCDRALLGAFANDRQHVSSTQIRQAARQWRGEHTPRRFWSRYRFGAVLAAFGLLGSAAMVSAYVGGWQTSALTQTVGITQAHSSSHPSVPEQLHTPVPSSGATRLPVEQPHPAEKSHSAAQPPPAVQQPSASNEIPAQSPASAGTPATVQTRASTERPAAIRSPAATEVQDAGHSSITGPDEHAPPVPAVAGQTMADKVVALGDADAKMAWPLPYGIRSIGPGSPPRAVRWLRRELDRIEGTITEENGPLFDNRLRARVMALQRSNGLVADGIAGPHTLNYMHVIYGTPMPFQVDSSQPRS